MVKTVLGSVVAAVAMFLIGFLAFGTPLMRLGYAQATTAVQLDVQTALKALPGTGTYVIPAGESPETTTAFAQGPVALIQYNAGGFAMVDPGVMLTGFLHMTLSALLLALTLYGLRGRGDATLLPIGIAAVAAVFINLSEPIWFHTDWRNALYVGGVNFISLAVAGLMLTRWFIPKA